MTFSFLVSLCLSPRPNFKCGFLAECKAEECREPGNVFQEPGPSGCSTFASLTLPALLESRSPPALASVFVAPRSSGPAASALFPTREVGRCGGQRAPPAARTCALLGPFSSETGAVLGEGRQPLCRGEAAPEPRSWKGGGSFCHLSHTCPEGRVPLGCGLCREWPRLSSQLYVESCRGLRMA